MFKNIWFFTAVAISLVLTTPVALLAGLLRLVGLGRVTQGFFVWFAHLWARFIIFMTGSRLVVEGMENVPLKGPVCFVGNHQGDFDIIIALALIRRPFGFIAKKETIYIPFIGIWVWLLGGLLMDRNSPRKAMKTIQKGADDIRRGGAMLIFPEGTRSKGRGLLPFRAGAFKLATLAEADIVPMAIEDSWRVWEEHRKVKAVPVTVKFGQVISTKGLDADGKRALSESLHKCLENMLKV